MRIRYHVAVDSQLQRSVVEFDRHDHLGRRIVFLVRQQDASPMPNLESALWQERLPHANEWSDVSDPFRAQAMERDFVAQLIDNKDNPAPMQDANGAWRHDAAKVLNQS